MARRVHPKTKRRIKKAGNRRFLQSQGLHCQEWHWCELPAGHTSPCLGAFMIKDKT